MSRQYANPVWLLVMALLLALAIALATPPARGAPVETTYLSIASHNDPEDVVWAYNSVSLKWDMLYFFCPYPLTYWTVVAIDTDTHNVYKWEHTKAYGDQWRLGFHLPAYINTPDGKVHFSVIGLHGVTYDVVYDPVAKTFNGVAAGASWVAPTQVSANLTGEMHQIRNACDGSLCFGGGWGADVVTANNGRVCVVVGGVQYGPIGRKQNTQQLQGFAYDGARWIYAANARNPYTIVAFDTTLQGEAGYYGTELFVCDTGGSAFAGVSQFRYGADCAVDLHGSGTRVGYWLYNGAAYAKATNPVPPWPGGSTDPASVWTPSPTKPTRDETALAPLPPAGVPGHGTVVYQYAPAAPQTATWTLTMYAVNDSRVWKMANGKLAVVPTGNLGAVIFDPATAGQTWDGITAALSAYCAAELSGHLYVGGYGNGRLYDYDEATGWTGDGTGNPTLLFTVKDDLGYQFDALMCGATCGSNVYFVAQDRRAGSTHGLLVAYAPGSASKAALYAPFDGYATDYVTSCGTRYVVVSTHRVQGTVAKPASGSVFVYDKTRTGNEFGAGGMLACIGSPIVPVVNSKGAGKIVGTDATHIVGWCGKPVASGGGWADSTTQSILYRMNVATGAVEQTVTLNVGVPWNYGAQGEANDLSLGPDGKLYLWLGNVLTRVDPTDLTKQTAVATSTPGGPIAWIGNDVYWPVGTLLHRLTNAAVAETPAVVVHGRRVARAAGDPVRERFIALERAAEPPPVRAPAPTR